MDIIKFIYHITHNNRIYNSLRFKGDINEKDYLESLIDNTLIPPKRINEMWSVIIGSLADVFENDEVVTFFSDRLLNYLISQKIVLCDLSHLKLDNRWLLLIYKYDHYCYEAALSVASRYIEQDNLNLDEFFNLPTILHSNFVLFYMLYVTLVNDDFSNIILNKCIRICDVLLSKNNGQNEIILHITKYKKFFQKMLNLTDITYQKLKCDFYNEIIDKNRNHDITSIQLKREKYLKEEIDFILNLRVANN